MAKLSSDQKRVLAHIINKQLVERDKAAREAFQKARQERAARRDKLIESGALQTAIKAQLRKPEWDVDLTGNVRLSGKSQEIVAKIIKETLGEEPVRGSGENVEFPALGDVALYVTDGELVKVARAVSDALNSYVMSEGDGFDIIEQINELFADV